MTAASMIARAALLVASVERGGRLFLAMMALQLALAGLAVASAVMLHGDGAYFVYAIAADAAWALKWSALSTRSVIYILAVAPTEWPARSADWSGLTIARVYAVFFYGVPLLQMAAAWLLAERNRPVIAILLTVQYAFGTGFGFGYPSEILLAPGFLWIALAALARTRPLFTIAAVATSALVFTHELAIPSAVLASWFAFDRWARLRRDDRTTTAGFVVFAAIVALAGAAWVRTDLGGGGSGAASNGIYVFDPRRVLNNPTLWIMAVVLLGTWAACRGAGHGRKVPPATVLSAGLAVAAGAVALGYLGLNFAQGRYDSARTLVALTMFALAGVFVHLQRYSPAPAGTVVSPGTRTTASAMLAAALCVQCGASLAFLASWSASLDGFVALVASDRELHPMAFVTARDLPARVGSRSARAIEDLDLSWTWPYRSIVVAPGFAPAAILVDDDTMWSLCQGREALDDHPGRVPRETLDPLMTYACSKPAPPDRRYVRTWLRRLFGLE